MALLRDVTGTRSLRAATGEQMEIQTVTGPTSYPTGGFSVVSNLGRVDEFTVQTPSNSIHSKNHDITGYNTMVTTAFSMGTGDAAAEGQEYNDASNLSGDEFVLTAYRL